ncbi:hypothetical protein ELH97_12995 [Rhizobium leguminosarum]|nr:hypothetical protein ELI05_13525 [Rhizobium leguminosarum]TAX92800.1 hypothetical protein ELH97_12995 [Rhizobium leguminosarum]TAX97336.1 hypothetical protein ELH94_12855 [Rhizobium leguminosarum]TAY99433.1 hypothetical protein ELH79_13510 [Rhizobium leguminosarum]TAZ10303.1 hypothetical protein ELH78_14395 [Rhizobium leguminosarum]
MHWRNRAHGSRHLPSCPVRFGATLLRLRDPVLRSSGRWRAVAEFIDKVRPGGKPNQPFVAMIKGKRFIFMHDRKGGEAYITSPRCSTAAPPSRTHPGSSTDASGSTRNHGQRC